MNRRVTGCWEGGGQATGTSSREEAKRTVRQEEGLASIEKGIGSNTVTGTITRGGGDEMSGSEGLGWNGRVRCRQLETKSPGLTWPSRCW